MSHPFDHQEEPMMTIHATPFEIIVLQAAIKHYTQNLPYMPQVYKDALPLLQRFQQRLVECLPSSVQGGVTYGYPTDTHAVSQDHRTT